MAGRPRDAVVHEHRCPAVRDGLLGEGTLACPRCDAPISISAAPLAIGARLSCPFCDAGGPVRDFLSLRPPSRPARVLVRIAVQRPALTRRQRG